MRLCFGELSGKVGDEWGEINEKAKPNPITAKVENIREPFPKCQYAKAPRSPIAAKTASSATLQPLTIKAINTAKHGSRIF